MNVWRHKKPIIVIALAILVLWLAIRRIFRAKSGECYGGDANLPISEGIDKTIYLPKVTLDFRVDDPNEFLTPHVRIVSGIMPLTGVNPSEFNGFGGAIRRDLQQINSRSAALRLAGRIECLLFATNKIGQLSFYRYKNDSCYATALISIDVAEVDVAAVWIAHFNAKYAPDHPLILSLIPVQVLTEADGNLTPKINGARTAWLLTSADEAAPKAA